MMQSTEPTKTFKIFISYAEGDGSLLNQLESHLSSLEKQRYIEIFHRRKIKAGSEWAKEIDTSLNAADIILLLVSTNFNDSHYCHHEMDLAMERHEAKKAHVIPVILRPVEWAGTPFDKLQPLPANGKPVTKWKPIDAGFENVVQGIKKVIDDLIIIPPVDLPYNLPPQNPVFTGREDFLKYLYETFFGNETVDSPRLVALTGLGGIGKTQIALRP